MYSVSAQGIIECIINVRYHYYSLGAIDHSKECS